MFDIYYPVGQADYNFKENKKIKRFQFFFFLTS